MNSIELHWLSRSFLRSGRKVLLLAGLVFCLLSCAPAPFGDRPAVEVPLRFSASGEADLAVRWWSAFDEPVLDDLIDRALQDNPDILQAWRRLDRSFALARQAGAGLIPQVDATGSAARSWAFDDDRTLQDRFQFGLAASYEIDLWGRVRAGRDAARLEAAASREDLQATVLALSAEVAKTWFRLAEQRQQLELLAEQQDLNEKILTLLRLRFRTGQSLIADVLQQRQLVEANRGEQARIKSIIALAEHQLAVLLGMPPGELVIPQGKKLSDLPPLPRTGLPASLLQRRPDVRSALFNVRAADRRVARSIAERFPKISLGGEIGTSSDAARDLFDNWLANLAANLVGPLVDGDRRRSEVDRARADAGEAFQIYRQVVLQALKDVEDALVQERRQNEYLDSLQQQLQLANEVARRVRDYYTKGIDDYQRVLNALLSQQQLQQRILTARLDLYEQRIALCKALAGDVPPAVPVL